MVKEKIAVIGDSFASDTGNDSWVTRLETDYTVSNYSQRGISQYRLYNIIQQNLAAIAVADHIVVFHTSAIRIYIPDSVDYPTRNLASHRHCDMVAGDVMKTSWDETSKIYYKYFFDLEQQETFYKLLVLDIDRSLGNRVIHCSGFNEHIPGLTIHSYADVYSDHPGNINHFDRTGNNIVYNSIKEMLC